MTYDKSIHALLPASIQSSGAIKTGVTVTGAPFSFKNGDAYAGVIPELAAPLSTIMGAKITLSTYDFVGLVPALQAKQIDMVWSPIIDTKVREQLFDMTAYLKEDSVLVVPAGNPKKITDVDSLCGLTAGGSTGSTQIALLTAQSATCKTEGKEEITIKTYPSQTDSLAAVQAGKLDALFSTGTVSRYAVKNAGNGSVFEVLSKVYPAGVLGIAVLKDNDGITKAFTAALKKLIASGEYKSILAKYTTPNQLLTPAEVLTNTATE